MIQTFIEVSSCTVWRKLYNSLSIGFMISVYWSYISYSLFHFHENRVGATMHEDQKDKWKDKLQCIVDFGRPSDAVYHREIKLRSIMRKIARLAATVWPNVLILLNRRGMLKSLTWSGESETGQWTLEQKASETIRYTSQHYEYSFKSIRVRFFLTIRSDPVTYARNV